MFVEELWKETDLPRLLFPAPPLDEIIWAVADAFGIDYRKRKMCEKIEGPFEGVLQENGSQSELQFYYGLAC